MESFLFLRDSRCSPYSLCVAISEKYKEAAPTTLALLEQCCNEVASKLARMDSKTQATSDVAHLRKFAMLYIASINNHVGALIDDAVDPFPEQWGKTTIAPSLEDMGIYKAVIALIITPFLN
ncbi:hypothetical protein RJT34_29967 [Clitoria ternatea]|uniref:Uncharacterized protein n=1 Tax=Clitoria ternatea TaxID=43366 RepID=A0AAN9EW59_CLITE